MKVPKLTLALLLACMLQSPHGNPAFFTRVSTDSAMDEPFHEEFVRAVQAEIRQILDGKPTHLSEAIFWENLKTVEKFYSSCSYMPAWWTAKGPTAQATRFLERLRKADEDGLMAQDYDVQELQQLLQKVQSRDQSAVLALDVAAFDVGMTASGLRYMSDLHRGRIDPRRAKWNVEPRPADFNQIEFLSKRLMSAANVSASLEDLEPAFPGYRRAKAALDRYLALSNEGEGTPIPVPRRPVHPGEKFSGLQPLLERLRRTGDFPANASAALSEEAYTGALVEAVKSFQARHGVPANGILDATTVQEISVPFNQRAAQLEFALERWRWLPPDTKPPMIVINIPEFQLRAYEETRMALVMPVIVGKAFKGRETPVFMDEMEYVIFRPYWNVPVDITRKELSVQAARDHEYLWKHGFTIVDRRDKAVEVDQLDNDVLRELRTGELQLRQAPGEANSLGLIKFVFPNNYSVYLHGTPETRLFERARRDFSHGCIRVQDPVSLAMWVLREDSGWTRERIEAATHANSSERANLRKPLPVLVLYSTAVVEENGEVRFYPDIYGLDTILKQLLAERPR